eukprot:Skav225059  [mRNA]  locus=scaffold3690:145446:145904:- [translate_table: standard]
MFSMARSGEYRVAGFPDFSKTLSELKQFQRSPQPEYNVCVPLGDGGLVIRQTLVDFWTIKHPDFAEKTNELLNLHNQEFNPNKLKRGQEESGEVDAAEEPPAKRLRLGTASNAQELESKYPERTGVSTLAKQSSLTPSLLGGILQFEVSLLG